MRSKKKAFLIFSLAGLVFGLTVFLFFHYPPFFKKSKKPTSTRPLLYDKMESLSPSPLSESQNCKSCHQKEFEEWEQSQHAWANRLIDPAKDGPAFSKDGNFSIGSSRAGVQISHGKYQLTWQDPGEEKSDYTPQGVIGVEPLWQYLIPFPGGRWQVFPLAWDPGAQEWFHVFGQEDRKANEWGHWKGRGNNWNSRCAFCHMTDFHKGYDPVTDSYHSTWREMGISCLQCHGEMKGHPNKEAPGSTNGKPDPLKAQQNCAACHSRREELTDDFHPGESFNDHYRLTLADQPGVYYPDGQVREEDFECGSLLLSRMGFKGITCLDCHDPHSGKLLLPANNNALCLSCHQPPGRRGAIPIEPLAHSHHPQGSRGNLCIECHMPVTRYMQRDPRRDHGFTIPDPLLTQELGIPNACNRCHTDRSTAWALGWAQKWYGTKMERRSRRRARIVARAQQQDSSVLPALLSMAKDEEIPAWQASMVLLLRPWAARPEVQKFLKDSLESPSPLVRSAAVRASTENPDASSWIQPLQKDPSRLVRLDAAWAGLSQGKMQEEELEELVAYLKQNSDQPQGALREAQFALYRGKNDEAESWIRKAADWDPSSAFGQFLKGRFLKILGKNAEALAAFQTAQRLDPENADYSFALALMLAELQRPAEALKFLEKTVALDPSFGRAWYNLGLLYAQTGRPDAAITALKKAEQQLPTSPEPAYAEATIFYRRQKLKQAKEAAQRALQRDPQFAPAGELLHQLSP